MTQATDLTYEGRWRKLANLSSDSKGSIHDDDTARAMGFRGGFVPGSTVGTAAMPAIVDRFGSRWMEGGWYSFKFVRPVYVDEEVREVAELAGDGDLSVRVVARDGRLCCEGAAGLGDAPPWDTPGEPDSGGDEVLAGIELGQRYPDGELLVTAADVAPMLEAGGDQSDWYRESSPWGRGVIPPERLMNAALQLVRSDLTVGDEVVNPGMWAEHALAVTRPMFLDEPYVLSEHVAEKGLSGRTIYLTLEFSVRDAAGTHFATGRHKIKWFRRTTPDS